MKLVKKNSRNIISENFREPSQNSKMNVKFAICESLKTTFMTAPRRVHLGNPRHDGSLNLSSPYGGERESDPGASTGLQIVTRSLYYFDPESG